MNSIKTLIITFTNSITTRDIPLFRGAVIASLDKKDINFHNHTENGFRYSYPRIQYKRIHGKAAIVCIGEGTESIGEFFSSNNYDFAINNETTTFQIEKVEAFENEFVFFEGNYYYHLHNWIPLNQENYNIYINAEGLIEKTRLLERILTANILSFLKSFNIFLKDHIDVSIIKILKKKPLRYKSITFIGIDLLFKTNVKLPNYIGIGKSASSGFGIITCYNNHNMS